MTEPTDVSARSLVQLAVALRDERGAETSRAMTPIALTTVTITGADDSVQPEQLANLSERYPFVEWGLLFSADRFGTPRYPSRAWVNDMVGVAETRPMALSAHLCGRFARAAVNAEWDWQRTVREAAWAFARVQINCANQTTPAIGPMLSHWPTTQRLIIQCGGKNALCIEAAVRLGLRGFDVLFDNSGGRGEQPNVWPHAFDHVRCGYAGGLGPDNVVDALVNIHRAAEGRPFWIDMESAVRSADGEYFDLRKVHAVLSALRLYAKGVSERPI